MAITINGDGTLTGVSVGGLPDGIVDTDMLATNAVSAAKLQSTAIASSDLPAGSILQVKTTIYDTFTSETITANTRNELNFSVAITPRSTSSKILISVHLFGEGSDGNVNNAVLTVNRKIGATDNYLSPSGDVSSRNRGLTMVTNSNPDNYASSPEFFQFHNYLDSPNTTSEITYIPTLRQGSTGFTWYYNQCVSSTDSANFERGVSWITVMEVAA